MSVEPNLLQLVRRMRRQSPDLLDEFVAACESAGVSDPRINSTEFLARCTVSASSLAAARPAHFAIVDEPSTGNGRCFMCGAPIHPDDSCACTTSRAA